MRNFIHSFLVYIWAPEVLLQEIIPKVELSDSDTSYPILPVIYASVNSCFGTVNI